MGVLGKDAPALKCLAVATCTAGFRVKLDRQHQIAAATSRIVLARMLLRPSRKRTPWRAASPHRPARAKLPAPPRRRAGCRRRSSRADRVSGSRALRCSKGQPSPGKSRRTRLCRESNVRLDAIMLLREQLASSAEPGLDLVENTRRQKTKASDAWRLLYQTRPAVAVGEQNMPVRKSNVS
jgi:hypothetical protein